MKKASKIKFISLAVIVYMIAALTWWAILLHRKNAEIKQLNIELSQTKSGSTIRPTESQISELHDRQERMILGEGIVFGLALIAGLVYIYRVYRQEISVAEQQRNFLLSITHETKTPLASVKLVLQTLQKRQLNPDQIHSLTSDALEETDRLDNLVNKLLLSAKFEGNYVLNFEKVPLLKLLQDVTSRFSMLYPDRHIVVNNQELVPQFIRVDNEAFQSILINLVENALKYSSQDIEIDAKTDDQQTVIDISDHGTTLNKTEKLKIFQKFYRVGNEDTRSSKGTGLGLYICQQLIKAHSGTIQVLTRYPKGNIFRITLPLSNK